MTHGPGDPGWPALWPDPPWRMRGRYVTARFPVAWDVVRRCVHPLLAPEQGAELTARLRFWELSFESLAADQRELGPSPSGTFREAIVAFPGRFEGKPTESATFIWTDSQVYLTWGREFFGWPVELADVSLGGDLWSREPFAVGATGSAVAGMAQGAVSLDDLRLEADLPWPSEAAVPTFATMRRLLQAGRPNGGVEAVLTEMEVIDRGRRVEASGGLALDLEPGHPLHGLAPETVTFEAVDGIECIVGHRVRVIGEPSVPTGASGEPGERAPVGADQLAGDEAGRVRRQEAD